MPQTLLIETEKYEGLRSKFEGAEPGTEMKIEATIQLNSFNETDGTADVYVDNISVVGGGAESSDEGLDPVSSEPADAEPNAVAMVFRKKGGK